MDMNTWDSFVPVDQDGALANKLIVLAKEGNKITIGGYSEADTPEPLNSSVKYRYYNGEYFRNGNTPAANTYKVVSGNKKWTNGNWYVVTEDVTISERITTSGDVNLVLCDGAKLTAKKGISVNGDNWYNPNQNATLNIYSQSGGTGTLFAGTIDGTNTTMPDRPQNAAIGGNSDFQNGSITIHGGNITAIAYVGAAGIGGGQDEPCSTVTVYGGNVTAGCTGGYGSGIGGGYDVQGGSVNVAGGHVIAYESGGEDAAAIGNMVENINLTVADGSEIKAGSSDSDAAVVASSNDALKKSYVEINAPALPQAYDITWKNDDGSVIDTTTVAAGETPTYDGATPEKSADAEKHYTFSGWSPAVATATEDATYTAVFTETAHSYNSNPTFNWTQDANGDWNRDKLTLSCECGETQDYEVTGYFGASAVTCTANADGSFTYSVAKTVDGTKYQDTKSLAANGVVKSTTQLKAAAKKGGSWELGTDLTGVTDVQCANGFVLDGKNHTVTRHANVSTQAVFRTTTNPAVVTLKNLTIDGIAGQSDLKPAIATKQSNPSNGNVINLENVIITNYDFDQANNGVVLAWGQATVNMKDCNVVTDSDYDVWGGAAATVNIDGGEVGTVYLNGGTASAAVTNGAVVDEIVAYPGSTITADSGSNITPPADYKVKDNGDGTYSIVAKEYVAQVNDGQKYESLAEAISAAEDGDTITVLADTDVAYASIANKNITIDATGYTVTGGQMYGMNVPMFVVKSTGGLTLSGGTFTNAEDSVVNNNGTLVVDGATLNGSAFGIYNGGNLTVSSGSVSGAQNSVNNAKSSASTTITGGSFTGKLQNTAGTIAISGGTFDTDVDVFAAPGYVGTQLSATTFGVKVDDNPLNGIADIVGYQVKVERTEQSTGDAGNDIGTKGVRILTKVNKTALDARFTEYG
ncbi:MAG: hypothetical protein IJ725_01595, partial [Ruminococcus sp.]|nr:hypothetical protein [Ruminococcus sp.]